MVSSHLQQPINQTPVSKDWGKRILLQQPVAKVTVLTRRLFCRPSYVDAGATLRGAVRIQRASRSYKRVWLCYAPVVKYPCACCISYCLSPLSMREREKTWTYSSFWISPKTTLAGAGGAGGRGVAGRAGGRGVRGGPRPARGTGRARRRAMISPRDDQTLGCLGRPKPTAPLFRVLGRSFVKSCSW